MKNDSIHLQLVGIPETLLLPLYMRAQESRRAVPIIRDAQAVALVERLDLDVSRLPHDPDDQAILCLRSREIDRMVNEALDRLPGAVVLHAGCGLDGRRSRLARPMVEWYDLDVPVVVDLRRRLLPAEDPERLLSGSVLDPQWMDVVARHGPRPFVLVAEGVLQYLEEAQVRSLVMTIQRRFPDAELVCDLINAAVLCDTNRKHEVAGLPSVRWAVAAGGALESWSAGIELLDEWYYLDSSETRLEVLRAAARVHPELYRCAGICCYRLGASPPCEHDAGVE